jgi:hypothetical protein
MDKQILAAFLLDESVALLSAEPLDFTLRHVYFST